MKKKILLVLILLVCVMQIFTNKVKATTESELKDYIFSEKTISGEKFKIKSSDKVKLERIFEKEDITDEQATKIKEYIDLAIKLMNEDNATLPEEVSTSAKKSQLLDYAKSAANVLGYSVRYDVTEKRLDIYDADSSFVDSITWGTKSNSLAQTGSSNYAYVVCGTVLAIAVVMCVIAKKKAEL